MPSDSQEKVHDYFIFLHLFKEIHSRNIIAESCESVECLSAAWSKGLEGRFYDGRVCKIDRSTPTQTPLLCPWTRCFTTIVSTWWNLTSSKLEKLAAKFKRKIRKHRQLLSYSLDSSYAQRLRRFHVTGG